MGFINFIICIVGTYLNYVKGTNIVFFISAIALIVNFWTWGIMNNFKDNPQQISNSVTTINFISFVVGLIMLIVSFFR